MEHQVRLLNFVLNAGENGSDLTGCLVDAGKYSYQLIGVEDNSVKVYYGEAFENIGSLVGHMHVSHLSIGTVRKSNGRKNGAITIHCHPLPSW